MNATTHIMTDWREGKSPEYNAFLHAKHRCENSGDKSFANYGGRGIEFKFKSFAEFLAALGRRPTNKHSLNRIDNDGHYEIGNVEWALDSEQRKNRRATRLITAYGKSQTAQEWARECGRTADAIKGRIRRGRCIHCVVSSGSGNCTHKQD